MHDPDLRYPADSNPSAPPAATPHYDSSVASRTNKFRSAIHDRYIASVRFIITIQGILNIIVILALASVLISACLSSSDSARIADNLSVFSNAKVSAFHTRNAVIVFAAIGLAVILVDTIIRMTPLMHRFPPIFHFVYNIVLLVIAAIYLILGCCSAAWAKKMSDTTVGAGGQLQRTSAPIAASFFLFVAMIALIIIGILRFIRPTARGKDAQVASFS
jgi:hypothetical protein